MLTPLNQPAFYFPLQNGRYEIKPGLFPFATDLGNGACDSQLFQFDNTFSEYRNNKLVAANESRDKYICLPPPGISLFAINQFIVNSLCKQHPEYFVFDPRLQQLDCKLTNEQLLFNPGYKLNTEHSHLDSQATYLNSWDALAMQVQEDMAVMQIDNEGKTKLVALHLCAPNHWAAEDKINQDFLSIHENVPGMERINQRSREINLASLHKGPFVRFAWGLATDKRLNHHPLAPENIAREDWQGRSFTPSNPELYLRVERQTLTGFSADGLVLFTIRTYFYPVVQLSTQEKILLFNAIQTMTDEALLYKGLQQSKAAISTWLKKCIEN